MGEFINGVDVEGLGKIVEKVRADSSLARFQFRVANRWDEGSHSVTTIEGFYGVGGEQASSRRSFTLEADEPPILLGGDRAPNAVEHLLNALAVCLTGTLAFHAAARGIRLERVESCLRGELDLRGFLGVSDEVRKGCHRIEASFRVAGEGTEEELEELLRFSPVLDVVSHGTEVALHVEKMAAAQQQAVPSEGAPPPS